MGTGLPSAGYLHTAMMTSLRTKLQRGYLKPLISDTLLHSSTLEGLQPYYFPVHTMSLGTFQCGPPESPGLQNSHHYADFPDPALLIEYQNLLLLISFPLRYTYVTVVQLGMGEKQILVLVADK